MIGSELAMWIQLFLCLLSLGYLQDCCSWIWTDALGIDSNVSGILHIQDCHFLSSYRGISFSSWKQDTGLKYILALINHCSWSHGGISSSRIIIFLQLLCFSKAHIVMRWCSRTIYSSCCIIDIAYLTIKEKSFRVLLCFVVFNSSIFAGDISMRITFVVYS